MCLLRERGRERKEKKEEEKEKGEGEERGGESRAPLVGTAGKGKFPMDWGAPGWRRGLERLGQQTSLLCLLTLPCEILDRVYSIFSAST